MHAIRYTPVGWPHFCKDLCARFDRESHFLGHLSKLKQMGLVKQFIVSFEQLAICTDNLSIVSFIVSFGCFISGMKEAI